MKKLSNRRLYVQAIESTVRSLSGYLKQIKFDLDIIYLSDIENELKEAKKAQKEAAEPQSKKEATDRVKAIENRISVAKEALQSLEVRNRISVAKEALQDMKLSKENISLQYLKMWFPLTFNKDGQICDIKKLTLENELKAKESGFEIVELENGLSAYLLPVKVFTANKLLAKFVKARKNEIQAQKFASQIEREREKRERTRAREEAILARAAAIMKARKESTND